MALTATIYRVEVTLSDVDRGVYETLDLRLARHPSESARFLMTRLLGYCLSYEEGIAFSKGGISSVDEAPIAVHDPTGILLAWIDVGSPSAERLHKASKAARKVELYTHADLGQLRREAASRPIHKLEAIDVWRFEPSFLDALEAQLDRNTKLELARNDGQLYVTVNGKVIEGEATKASLVGEQE
ncbi:MAG TPA: YaeQ family protein [Polyangiaceae bacterium]